MSPDSWNENTFWKKSGLSTNTVKKRNLWVSVPTCNRRGKILTCFFARQNSIRRGVCCVVYYFLSSGQDLTASCLVS